MNLFDELKRRNVFRVGAAYLVVGWVVMQVIDVVVEPLRLPEWTATLVIVLLLVGLPITLFLAWAFELTPDGVKKAEDVAAGESVTAATGQKLNYLIIGALVLAVAGLLYDRSVPRPVEDVAPESVATTEPVQKSIAVLPFANLSADPEQEFFADGVAEEILNRLARTADLRVISRSSSFTFKGRNVSIPEVAAVLKVNHVLEGSVRRAGNRVRITAQLIEVGTDAHLWSETFDRELVDIFALEDEIAGAIADALTVTLGFGPARGVYADMGDYDLMLKGRALVHTRRLEDIRTAIPLFEELVRRNPDLAEAHAQLSFAQMLAATWDYELNEDEFQALLEIAAGPARRALALDDRDVTALVVLAAIHRERLEFVEADRLGRLALEISPSSGRANNWYGDLLFAMQRTDEAIEIEGRAVELDPLLAVNHQNLGNVLLLAGRIEDAISAYRRAIEIDPAAELYSDTLAQFYIRHNRLDDLAELLGEPGVYWAPENKNIYERIAARDRAGALRLLEQVTENSAHFTNAAWILGSLGEYDRAAGLLATGKITVENIMFPTIFPTEPELLAAHPAYAAFWRTPPYDRLLKARGHWVDDPGVEEE